MIEVAQMRDMLAKAWQQGFDAGAHMARCWGHIDNWESPMPVNPFTGEEAE